MAIPIPSWLKKLLHILGVICAYAAGVILILAGILEWSTQPPGQLITWGIAFILASTVAVIDGAGAMPSVGMWKVGAKFEGLSDLGVILIIVILGAGFGISMAF